MDVTNYYFDDFDMTNYYFDNFQMDVTNYYPMKELLRDKYFDEGKFAALHLMLYMYFYVALILMQH